MDPNKISGHITNWLKNYAENASVQGFVIGVSGGIDSAVTATLCAQTGMNVLLLEMPIHQAENQVNRAQELIKKLIREFPNVSSQQVNLTPVYESFVAANTKIEDADKVSLSLANSRARLRMTTLYYYAGLHGLLVAGTGNKVEDFGVGFYTKYGDGGVDLSPIADLMKSEVYQLGKFLNVPQSILIAAPTDGLFGDNRTDEDQLGASYDELEWAMKQLENHRISSEFTGREKIVFELFSKLNRANQHKMLPIPICQIPQKLK
jgi:NAD+ synthase